MSAFHGKLGKVIWGTGLTHLDTNCHSWTIDYSADAGETTAWTVASPWPRTFIPGLTTWSGSYEMRDDSTGTPEPSDIGYMTQINIYTGHAKYSGSAFITGYSPTISVDAVAAVTVSFQGSGAIARSTY